MTQSYWPFDNADTTENQYSQLMRRLQSTGVFGDPGDTTLSVSADSTGLNVKLSTGYAFIRGYMYYNDAVVTIPIGAGSAGARVDRVVLRCDPGANTITPVVIPGTSGSSTPNEETQTDAGVYDLVLADVDVAANAATITPGDVSDRRTFMGHIYGDWETVTRPESPRKGQPGYNATTGRPEYWTGAAWSDFAPATVAANTLTGQVSVANGGTGSNNSADARAALGITPANIGASPTGHTHDDRYYTETESDNLLAGKSNTNHIHDDRYYTENELNAFLAGKSDTGHNHDSRYYTESEVDTFLNGKANVNHTHSWSTGITGKPTTFPPSAHTHDASDIASGILSSDRIAGYSHSDSIVRIYPGNTADGGTVPNFRVSSTPIAGIYNGDTPVFGWHGGTGHIFAYGVYDNILSTDYRSVYVTGDGQWLGHVPSAREYKDIHGEYVTDMKAFLDLPTHWYTFKSDPEGTPRAGYIADEMSEHFSEFVSYEDGKPMGINYEFTVVMLHSAIKQQNAMIEDLREKLGVLEQQLSA